jgi:hypothetical protein
LVNEQRNKNKIAKKGKAKPSPVHVSLDNADTVIEGAPFKPSVGLSGVVRLPDTVCPSSDRDGWRSIPIRFLRSLPRRVAEPFLHRHDSIVLPDHFDQSHGRFPFSGTPTNVEGARSFRNERAGCSPPGAAFKPSVGLSGVVRPPDTVCPPSDRDGWQSIPIRFLRFLPRTSRSAGNCSRATPPDRRTVRAPLDCDGCNEASPRTSGGC